MLFIKRYVSVILFIIGVSSLVASLILLQYANPVQNGPVPEYIVDKNFTTLDGNTTTVGVVTVEPVKLNAMPARYPALYCLKVVSDSPYDMPIPIFIQEEAKGLSCGTYMYYSYSPYDAAYTSALKEDKSYVAISCEEAENLYETRERIRKEKRGY